MVVAVDSEPFEEPERRDRAQAGQRVRRYVRGGYRRSSSRRCRSSSGRTSSRRPARRWCCSAPIRARRVCCTAGSRTPIRCGRARGGTVGVGVFANALEFFWLGVITPLTAVCVIPLYPAFLARLSRMVGGRHDDRRLLALFGVLVVAGRHRVHGGHRVSCSRATCRCRSRR